MIPREFIDELLARIDIVDIIDQYVPLKKGGANTCSNPFDGRGRWKPEDLKRQLWLNRAVAEAKRGQGAAGGTGSGESVAFLQGKRGRTWAEVSRGAGRRPRRLA